VKRWLRLFAAAVVAVSCKPDPEKYDPRCESYPDFVVTIHTATTALPRDTRVEVNYGGTLQELYHLHDHVKHQVLFCVPLQASGGDGGAGGDLGLAAGAGGSSPGSIDNLRCSLWTQGPAEVIVSASGFQNASEMLAPARDDEDCTLSKELELEPAAAR